jgi:hypothetical protein
MIQFFMTDIRVLYSLLMLGAPIALWLDMGTSDPWIESTTAFHNLLADDAIAHSWHTSQGGHGSGY